MERLVRKFSKRIQSYKGKKNLPNLLKIPASGSQAMK